MATYVSLSWIRMVLFTGDQDRPVGREIERINGFNVELINVNAVNWLSKRAESLD